MEKVNDLPLKLEQEREKMKIMTNICVYEVKVQCASQWISSYLVLIFHFLLFCFPFSALMHRVERKVGWLNCHSLYAHPEKHTFPFEANASRRVILSFVRELNAHAFNNTLWNAALINCVCVCARHSSSG